MAPRERLPPGDPPRDRADSRGVLDPGERGGTRAPHRYGSPRHDRRAAEHERRGRHRPHLVRPAFALEARQGHRQRRGLPDAGAARRGVGADPSARASLGALASRASGGLREEVARVTAAHARERKQDREFRAIRFRDGRGLAAHPRAEVEVALEEGRQRHRPRVRQAVERKVAAREDAIVLGAHEARARHAMDRGDGVASVAQWGARSAEDVVVPVLDEVARQRGPQVRHHARVRIARIDARAIDLDHALAKHDQQREIEIAVRHVAARPSGIARRQDAVRAADVAGPRVAHDEMVAVVLEAFGVGTRFAVSREDPFAKGPGLGDACLVADDSRVEARRLRLHASRLRCHRSSSFPRA